jgi:hypothetical protein
MAGLKRHLVAGLLGLALLCGCSHFSGLHWPWSHKAPAAPTPVVELNVMTESGVATSIPQYWKRNTLVVDLRGASDAGGLILKPRPGTQWPVRVAFRVAPGSGVLEVLADQRVVMPIAASGTQPIDLELAADVYTLTTAQIIVRRSPG